MESFANTVRRAWFEKRVKVGTFAEEVGIESSHASGILKGSVSAPRPPTILRIAKYLDLDYEELLAIAHVEKRPEHLRIETLHDCTGQMLEDQKATKQKPRRRSAGRR